MLKKKLAALFAALALCLTLLPAQALAAGDTEPPQPPAVVEPVEPIEPEEPASPMSQTPGEMPEEEIVNH